jgi:hypothetical protein
MRLSAKKQQSIISWAEATPKITAVFLLGGRAHGAMNPDIQLGLSLGGAGSWWALLTFLYYRRVWKIKLQKLLGLRVYLELVSDRQTRGISHQTEAAIAALWRRGSL